jgi:hypothetical protein
MIIQSLLFNKKVFDIDAVEKNRGQRSEVSGQRSEVSGQRSEVRSQRARARGQRSAKPMAE